MSKDERKEMIENIAERFTQMDDVDKSKLYRREILFYLKTYAVLQENVTMDIKGIWNCLIRA